MFEKLSKTLVGVPATLVGELFHEFESIKVQYISGHWEQVLVGAGRFCEVIYSLLDGKSKLSYPPHANKPRNLLKACENLQNTTNLSESERVIVPRMLVAIYTFRSKRNGGHIGESGDKIGEDDAAVIVSMIKWVLCELVRGSCATSDAVEIRSIIQQINEDWEVVWTGPDDIARISRPGILTADQTLLLLARSAGQQLPTKQLITACGYKNGSRYRRDVLEKLAREKCIFLELPEDKVYLMPEGTKRADAIARRLATK